MRLLIYIVFLISIQLQAQCPFVNLGPDITIPCGDSCTTITANYLQTYQTTSYVVSQIPYNPDPYNVGTLVTTPIDDRWSPIINLPFTFCFFGQTYNQYVIGTNGIISFNLAYANQFCPWAFNAALPSTVLPRSMIGLYHDIDPSVAGDVYYNIYGSYPCRRLVVSFYNTAHFACNSLISNFQIILYELTNIIEIHIQRKQTCNTWNGGRACLGIQNPAGTTSYTPPGRNTGVYTINIPEAWRFTPNGTPTHTFNWLNTNNTNPIYPHCYESDSTLIGRVVYDICGGGQITKYDTINVSRQEYGFGLGISIN
jgi:hypothetical protein